MTHKRLEDRAGDVAGVLKTLSHPVRLMLVCALVEGEFSVGELEQRIGTRQPTLSQQLGVLRAARIVKTRRAAKQIIYRLAENRTAQLVSALYEIYCAEGEPP
jgi:DNA-binding transcriptional ArsR family regulator